MRLLEPSTGAVAAGGSPLGPRALTRVAAAIGAAAPVHLLPASRGDHERRWAVVAETTTYQAWLIAWPPGTGLGLHDHDGSAAGVHVVAGLLRERYLGADGRLHVRTWAPGDTHELGPDHVHEVVSAGEHEALTVHVYSPRLADVRFRIDSAITP